MCVYKTIDVYEESEADLVTENSARSTKSRSPDASGASSKSSNYDRKISSGYFS